jgi:carbon-monoxide dehydrogenase large subunit
VEDFSLLTGKAEFVDDLRRDRMAYACFVRSPIAHGAILGIDAAGALALPGTIAVVGAAELNLPPLVAPLEIADAFSPPRPLLAGEVVRFVGEPVAVVVATSVYAAEDAAEAVEVAYAPRPALVDPVAAATAEPLHANGSNVLFERSVSVGDVDAAFAEAATVVERSFVSPRYSATPIEPRGVVAEPDGDGVTIWSSTQSPHRVASIAAELLRLPPGSVRVICPDIGGGFGQKAHAYPEEIVVAWLARRLGRPVKWTEDRVENLLASSHARDQHVRVRAAVDATGRLTALDADVTCDTGAYGVFPHGHVLEAMGTPSMIPGPYRVAAYRFSTRSVATTKCPEGAYRGVGLPVAAFVHERVMDILAGAVDVDRADIRRVNLVRSEDMPYTSITHHRYDSGDYRRALDAAAEAIGWDGFRAEQLEARREGRHIGVGLSCYVEYSGLNSAAFSGRGMAGIAGFDGAHVALDDSGGATIWTTLPAIGQGSDTTFGQVVADQLGLRTRDVRIARSDTGVGGLQGTGTFASRSAISGGGALVAAAGELRRRLLEDASDALEADPADLEIVDGLVRVVGTTRPALSVGELVRASAADRYRLSTHFDPPRVAYPYGTHACRVDVDTATGRIRIDRYVIVEDCGRIINPLIVEGQTHGAAAQGIGGALVESLVYGEDGQLLTASLMDYLLPTALDVPELYVTHLEIPAPESPLGVKGVGEGGTLSPSGAIANAVVDALGVELNELPLTPERVRDAALRTPWASGRAGRPLDALVAGPGR